MLRRMKLHIAIPTLVVAALLVPLSSVRSSYELRVSEDPAIPGLEEAFDSEPMTHTVYVPLIHRHYTDERVPMGVQYYGALNETNGFGLMAQARPGWVRFPVHWAWIEPENTTPDQYQWYEALDESLANADEAGVRVLLTISDQPSWVSEYPMGPPHDTEELHEFVWALVERYDGDGYLDTLGSIVVEHFELYNEPDCADASRGRAGTHGYWGHRGTEYAELLEGLYPVVKSANTEAKLVMGGLALDWFEEDGGIFDDEFLEDVLAACQGKQCFDYVNFHYYPLFYGQWTSYGYGIIGKTNYVREKMTQFNAGHLPAMCSEMGWSSGEAIGWGGTEAQARYAVQGFVRGLSVNLDSVIWFKAHDRGMEDGQPGLLDTDLNPKASYYAFSTTSRLLAGAEYLGEVHFSGMSPVAEVEGYRFRARSGNRLDILWTMDDTPFDPEDDPVISLAVEASRLRVVDKTGSEGFLDDAMDGNVDGQVTLQIGGSPLFLEYLE